MLITTRKYGWNPDVPDFRDYKLDAPKQYTYGTSADLRSQMSPVEDQKTIGSCTGNAIVGAMEYLENKNKQQFVDLSRLFVYYNERLIEGTVNQDSGAMIRDGIKSLVKYGVCAESLWPYDISKFKNKPNAKCYTDATKRKIISYYRFNKLDDILQSISDGYPVVFGFSVYESFESQEVAKTGIVPMPSPSERMLGGHAVCCVGFNTISKMLIVRNSWGPNWGDKGYFYLSFGFVTDPNLSADFWTIRK